MVKIMNSFPHECCSIIAFLISVDTEVEFVAEFSKGVQDITFQPVFCVSKRHEALCVVLQSLVALHKEHVTGS